MEQRLVFVSAFDALVSEDIAACVAEWDAATAIRVSPSHEDTVRDLADVPSVFAVIARGPAARLDETGLPNLVADRGGRLVWVSDAPLRISQGTVDYIHVAMPFTADMLRDALSAAARRGGRPDEA